MSENNSLDHSKFVLRLLVVKVEGVLIPPVSDWSDRLVAGEFDTVPTGDELFSEWVQYWEASEEELRSSLVDLARSDYFTVDPDVMRVMEYAHDHSPIRVALLSTGPEEWLEALMESLGIAEYVDLPYSYDRYTHGSRRTLLQFLMNRFIAGRERTLFLGNSTADERLAEAESTRFRSFSSPPPEALDPEQWNWSAEELLEYMKEKQPRE